MTDNTMAKRKGASNEKNEKQKIPHSQNNFNIKYQIERETKPILYDRNM